MRVLFRSALLIGLLWAAQATAVAAQAPTGSTQAQSGPGRLYLPFVLQPPAPLTAFELIDAAEEAGRLAPHTALLYRVYAAHGDSRLPATYRGAVTEADGERAMIELTRDFLTLPVETQRAAYPFLLPPGYVGSWYDLRRYGGAAVAAAQEAPAASPPPFRNDWDSVTTANGKAKVWWNKQRPMDAEPAGVIARLLNDHAWPKLTGLLGREPISDAGGREIMWDGKTDIIGDSGDGKFDLYILDCQGACPPAQVVPYGACEAAPVLIWFNANGLRDGVGQVNVKKLEAMVSHEFMHALTKSYPKAQGCDEYLKMEEAWGNWAIDYVFPSNQTENEYWDRFRAPDYPLFDFTGYEDWVFPYYLSKTFGDKVIKAISEQMAHHGPLAAVNQGLIQHTGDANKGLADIWDDYAVQLWNREAPADLFRRENDQQRGAYGNPLFVYGKGATRADITHEVELNGGQWVDYDLPVQLTGVSNRYYHFTFPDAAVRSLGVFNPFGYPGIPPDDLKIQALIKITGQADWKPVEDWTKKIEKQFCLQLDEEKVEELVIIFSNTQWETPSREKDAPAELPYKVVASNIACKGWTGSITQHYRYTSNSENRYEVTTSTDLRFERRAPDETDASDGQFYDVKQGQLRWELSGSRGNCRLQGSDTDTLQPGQGDVRINNTTRNTQYIGFGGPSGSAPHISTAYSICPSGTTTFSAGWSWWSGYDFIGQKAPVISKDGLRLEGTNEFTQGNDSWIWEYNLTAIP